MSPWVCNLWLPFLAPLGRVCYMETGWDGRKGARVRSSVPSELEKVNTGEWGQPPTLQ
ncbi:hypothetical protein I79_005699 [Cricetulus griseus]|uniref:Uncharacterized protein n=1 Tax=Cricetulus griseus TaxID=10029 RepID=G3H5V6_CRIGR|nr:hypothetical protein I79_005699 [Cricetulus griseus]